MTDQIIKIKPPTKIELCLIELLKHGAHGLIELEALAAYGETSLHSTISTLANSKDLTFKREKQIHKNRQGGAVYFTRYSLLNDDEITKAKSLLNTYQAKRGLKVAA
jgi:hypothetical protein